MRYEVGSRHEPRFFVLKEKNASCYSCERKTSHITSWFWGNKKHGGWLEAVLMCEVTDKENVYIAFFSPNLTIRR